MNVVMSECAKLRLQINDPHFLEWRLYNRVTEHNARLTPKEFTELLILTSIEFGRMPTDIYNDSVIITMNNHLKLSVDQMRSKHRGIM